MISQILLEENNEFKNIFKHGLSCSKQTRLTTASLCSNRLTLKGPIMTATDDKFSDIFPSLKKNKV